MNKIYEVKINKKKTDVAAAVLMSTISLKCNQNFWWDGLSRGSCPKILRTSVPCLFSALVFIHPVFQLHVFAVFVLPTNIPQHVLPTHPRSIKEELFWFFVFLNRQFVEIIGVSNTDGINLSESTWCLLIIPSSITELFVLLLKAPNYYCNSTLCCEKEKHISACKWHFGARLLCLCAERIWLKEWNRGRRQAPFESCGRGKWFAAWWRFNKQKS